MAADDYDGLGDGCELVDEVRLAEALAELRRLPQARETAPLMPARTREDAEMAAAEDRAAQRRVDGEW